MLSSPRVKAGVNNGSENDGNKTKLTFGVIAMSCELFAVISAPRSWYRGYQLQSRLVHSWNLAIPEFVAECESQGKDDINIYT